MLTDIENSQLGIAWLNFMLLEAIRISTTPPDIDRVAVHVQFILVMCVGRHDVDVKL